MRVVRSTAAGWAAGLLLATPLAWSHAHLRNSVPAAQAQLAAAPSAIVLTFDERIEPAMSSIAIKDAAGHDAAKAASHADASDPATMRLDLPALVPGAYTVRWVAVGRDGHRRTGEFTFTVKG